MNIKVLAPGRFRGTPEERLWVRYIDRLRWKINLIELMSQTPKVEAFTNHYGPKDFVLVMDENGRHLSSLDFSKVLDQARQIHGSLIVIIGGAYGIDESIKKRANLMLSLGAMTWPHLLVRVLVAEQLYRGQQILAGHPYHHE